MSIDNEKQWSAYLDGELSTSEAARFDESLAPRDNERLQAEMRLERGFAEVLSEATRCPDTTWAQICRDVHMQPKTRPTAWRWTGPLAALAATILILIGAALAYQQANANPPFLDIPADISFLPEWHDEWDHAQSYLHENNIQLALRPLDQSQLKLHGKIEFIGANHTTYHGVDVVQLYFECCRRPVMLSVAVKGSDAAHHMHTAKCVRKCREVGDYVVALVANHGADGLLDAFVEI